MQSNSRTDQGSADDNRPETDVDDTIIVSRPGRDVDVDDTVIVRPRHPEWDDTVLVSREDVDLDDTVLVARRGADLDDTVIGASRSRVPSGDRTAPPSVPRSAPVREHAVRVGTVVHKLEIPLIIGRRPSGPRIIAGPVPRLVAVASPTGEVSSSHVDIRHEGSSVVVTDLRSTNGTVVAMPGRAPVRLRQGESVVALAGTLVDIGDGNVLEILPPQRITFQEEPRP